MSSPAIEELNALLSQRNRNLDPEGRAEVDTRIQQRFLARRAVLITDMAGFSRITQEEGILHFLGLIQRMQSLVRPVIAEFGGHLVKAEADNVYATFQTPSDAVRAAVGMHDACFADAKGRHANDTVGVSIGLGWGEILDVDGDDFFGHEVNLASKLGEDIASGGETLATQAVVEAASDIGGFWWEQKTARISNIAFAYYALERTE